MEGKEAWSLLADAIGRFRNGAVGWTEDAGGTYYARILAIALSEGGARVTITFKWCAMQNLASKSFGGWVETRRRSHISVSKSKLLSAIAVANGQIDFDAEGKKGTLYPSGQTLPLRKVQRLGKAHPASK